MNTKNICVALLVMSAMFVSCEKGHGNKKHGIHCGHEYVDLGLPSGVKWATCNVGALTPEDYGGLYQWGGTVDVKNIDVDVEEGYCPYHTGSDFNTGWTKYVPSKYASYWSATAVPSNPDNKQRLDPEDDVANVEWGGKWRMPNEPECYELLSEHYCSCTLVTINGIKGYKVQSKIKGYTDRWIFLPMAGRWQGGNLSDVDFWGSYWSSDLGPDGVDGAAFMSLFPSSAHVSYNLGYNDSGRWFGRSIRPVFDPED